MYTFATVFITAALSVSINTRNKIVPHFY